MKLSSGNRDDGNLRFVTKSDVTAIKLVHSGDNLPLFQIWDFSDGHARIYRIAHLQER